MSHMNYTKVGKRSLRRHGASSTRGFRLKYPRRFSVQRLRARWRSSYGRAVQYLKRGMGRNSSIIDRCGSSERGFMMDSTRCHYMGKLDDQCRFRSFGRSNSFYSEAIADCLEFIKRSSISVEQKQVSPR
ncbi:serine/threonine-protein phosphatase [Salix suchowensis]|nr:serine/threonine-protein phosphatase [Salix suchowensis]KAG5235760.1 serine/threonine-protein phosphatase [Salix suchowensis]